MNKKTQITFLKKIHMLLKAGIPLEACFQSQMLYGSKKYKKIMHDIIISLRHGEYLSDILKKKLTFDPLSLALIKAGEQSGTLQNNIHYAAETLSKRQKIKQSIISSLFYPSIIAGMTIVLSCFLLFVIFPKIQPLFLTFKTQLPLSTRILIYLSIFLKNNGLYIAGCVVVCIGLYIFLAKKSESFKLIRDTLLIKIPFVKRFIIYYQTAIVTRSMGVMLKSGLSLDKALFLASESLFNCVYKKMMITMHANVIEGHSFSSLTVQFSSLIPAETHTLLATADTAGTLPETMIYCSEILEEHVEDLSKASARLLEPLLMIIMGAIVGFVALSMLSPIYSITQNLKQ